MSAAASRRKPRRRRITLTATIEITSTASVDTMNLEPWLVALTAWYLGLVSRGARSGATPLACFPDTTPTTDEAEDGDADKRPLP